VANRLLPAALSSRELAEVAVFFLAWIGTALHAGLHLRQHSGPPWRSQSGLIGCLALAALVANWLTTGDHPFHAWVVGHGAVLGVDAGLAVTALAAFLVAWRLGRRAGARQGEAWAGDRLATASTGVDNG
jgi:hypothetical protein